MNPLVPAWSDVAMAALPLLLLVVVAAVVFLALRRR